MTRMVKKEGGKNKLKLFLMTILIIFVVIAIIGYFLLQPKSTPNAYLKSISGDVQIFDGNSWIKAEQGMSLSLNNKIKTTNGEALLILFNSVFIEIKKETEIEVTSLIPHDMKIKQNSGSTWSKYLNLIGGNNYEVETKKAVASIRGTDFYIEIKDDETTLLVNEGEVSFSNENTNLSVIEFQKAITNNSQINLITPSKEDIDKILKRRQIVLNTLKTRRVDLIKEHEFMLSTLKKTYDVDENKLENYLERIDNGELNDRELINKSPIKLNAFDEFLKLNDEIKKTKILIEKFEYKNETN